MSDYIKRKDAIVRLWKQLRRLSDIIPMGKDAAGVAVRIIEDLPDADVVEVVRCKDCKYNPRNPRSWNDDDIVEHYLWCEFIAIESKYNYCSKGKRLEE